jgi:hypothetical protein
LMQCVLHDDARSMSKLTVMDQVVGLTWAFLGCGRCLPRRKFFTV